MGIVEPKRYRAHFIEPGVISYEDIGMGLVMVGREALDRMSPTFVGMPVFNFIHKEVEADEAFDFENAIKKKIADNLADGIIAATGTEDTPGHDKFGWDYADMLVWDEEAQKNLDEKNYSVSCAYDTLESGPPGKHNGIAFDEEVLNGKYVHMAIVNNPRYEGSTVMRNSKGVATMPTKAKMSWKIFGTKKNAEPTEEEKAAEAKKKADEEAAAKQNAEEGLQADEGAYMVIDGQKVPLQELVETFMGKQNADGGAISPEDEIELPDGTKVTGADLMKAYMGSGGAEVVENAAAPQAGMDDPDKTKQNSTNNGREQPNDNFRTIKKNAAAAAEIAAIPNVITAKDRQAVGKARYGSAVAGGK